MALLDRNTMGAEASVADKALKDFKALGKKAGVESKWREVANRFVEVVPLFVAAATAKGAGGAGGAATSPSRDDRGGTDKVVAAAAAAAPDADVTVVGRHQQRT